MTTSETAQVRLARALRGLLEDLHRTELHETNAAALAAEVEALRAGIEGPDRPRWYEPMAGVDDDARRQGWREWSLYRGRNQAVAPPMRVERLAAGDDQRMIGTVACSRMYEGPPGAVHGGYIAGLFDDILGACLSLVDGPSGVTGRLTVRFRQPTPLETPLRFEAWPTEVRSRRFRAHATCLVEGRVTAEAEGLFVRRPLDGDGVSS